MVIEDKDKKIQEIMKKSKEDKVKMYQFITEFEAYKENAEKEKAKNESTLKIYEAESQKSKESISTSPPKPVMIDRCLQMSDDEASLSCPNCAQIRDECNQLQNKLHDIEEATSFVLKEYDDMKQMLEETKKGGMSFMKACHDSEQKYNELQKNFQKQSTICSQILAENSLIRSSLSSISEPKLFETRADKHTNKVRKVLSRDDPIPSCLKALGIAERITASYPQEGGGLYQD